MPLRPSRIVLLLLVVLPPLLPLLALLFKFYSIHAFETALQASSITFSSFTQPYAEALINNGPLDAITSSYPPCSNNPDHCIPPLIHFIHFPNLYLPNPLHRPDHATDIPTAGSDAPAICLDLHDPNTTTILTWNETAALSLLEQHYPWFLPTYNTYRHPIQRVDAIKYFILHHHGGVYMDLDISCRRDLTPLFRFPAWLPKAELMGVNNDVLAARRGHPLFQRMIEKLEERAKWTLFFPYLTVYWSTGPLYAGDMLREYWSDSVGGEAKDQVFILPAEFHSERYSFFGHRIGGTWHGGDVAVVLWLVDHIRILTLVLGCAFGVGIWWRCRAIRRKGAANMGACKLDV